MNKEDTINFVRSLLISKKDSYELLELLKDFKQETGHQLPLFGYKTPLDFLKSIPDTVQLQLMESIQKIYVRAVNSPKSAHITSLVKRQNYAKNKFRFHCSWDYADYNKTENVHKSEKRTTNKEFQSNEQQSQTYDQSGCHKYVNSDLSPMSNNNIHVKCVKLLTDIVQSEVLGEVHEIPKINLNSYVKVGEYVEVCVPEVYSPHKFSLQLRKYKIKLTNLMIQLQSFYNTSKGKCMILTQALKTNQVCAALYKTNSQCSEWYRAVILSYVDEGHVVVLLIDYGTVTELEVRDLRYLHRQFGELPAQAFPGHLGNIQPCNGNDWPEKSSKRFLSLVFEKDLVAGVVDANYKDSWLSVALSYTDVTDVHISDTLVKEQLAVFDLNGVNKFAYSFTPLDLRALCHPEEIGRSRMLRSTTENYRTIRKAAVLSYSESNKRLKEMFSI